MEASAYEASVGDNSDLRRLRDEITPQLVEWRRHLHRHPELSFEEHETAAFIAAQLDSFGGLEVTRPTPTSVVARLGAGRPGPVVALRADIDALPIAEENSFEFVSQIEGTMHACGHDGHAAMLLGVAKILAAGGDEVPGEVRFIFQHAEEKPPGGACELVAAGVMQDVDVVLGCHLMATIPSGSVAVVSGPAMAAADMFSLTIRGRGGHAAFPHDTVDPIAVAAQVVTNLQQIVSREVDPLDQAVLSVTRIAGGTADNIIPESVELGGTVRTFTPELRQSIRAAMERTIAGVTAAHGAEYSFAYQVGYDAVVNDPQVAEVVAAVAREVVGASGVVEIQPMMGGDDFSAYLAEAPGTYFFVGTRDDAAESVYAHHHPRFTIDESTLWTGVETFVRSVRAYTLR
jgi:amidohydrolase